MLVSSLHSAKLLRATETKSVDSPTTPVPFAPPQLLHERTLGDKGEGVYSSPTPSVKIPSISFSFSHTAPETAQTIVMFGLDSLDRKEI